jgi:hypothetical protein
MADRAEMVDACQVFLLTDKPEVYLANAGEDETSSASCVSRLSACASGPVVSLTGKLEADLAELDEAERADFVAELGLAASGLERVIRACYEALDLVTFFTGVGAEVRAWAVPRGTIAGQAAGKIHSDMEEGFIKAEVASYDTLAELGSWQAAHKAGKVQTEGRDYVVQEGDVLLVRFST